MTQEVWKSIKGYEGHYEVSDLGRVKSLGRTARTLNSSCRKVKGRILKQTLGSRGYYKLVLSKDNIHKSYLVHHLVWDNFGSSPRNGLILQVDHVDGNKLNNRLANLQVLGHRQNTTKHYKSVRKEIPTGVHKVGGGKFIAVISINNKLHRLGTYNTQEEAGLAYQRKLLEVIK